MKLDKDILTFYASITARRVWDNYDQMIAEGCHFYWSERSLYFTTCRNNEGGSELGSTKAEIETSILDLS